MDSTELSSQFTIGERTVYRTYGMCSIEGREEMDGQSYLRLLSLGDGSSVLVPERNALDLGLRHLSTRSEVERVLSILSEKPSAMTDDWKQRLNEYRTLLKDGKLESYARVTSALYHRSKIKALPSMEKKLYDSALSLLLDEASIVLDKGIGEMRKIVFSYLEDV